MNCQVLGQSNSGVEYYAAGLINHLAQVAPDNDYIVFANRQSNGLDHLQSKHRVAIHRSPWIAPGRLGRITWEHMVLPCLARRHRLDLLHCPAYICPIVKTLPTVVTVHDTIALDHPEWCRSVNAWYYGLLLKHSISAADHVITVSNASAARIAHHVPGAKHKTTVIYPGLDPLFQPVRDPGALDLVRRRYNLPERYVLYVGNLEPKKNLPRLILAFQQFRRRGNANWNLVIIGGKTWGLAAPMEQLRCQGQLQNVTFPGYVRREDLPAVYCQAVRVRIPDRFAKASGFLHWRRWPAACR